MIVNGKPVGHVIIRKDIVFTPDWVARDMCTYFNPVGRVLEPCMGEGAIMQYLPGAEWCELRKGRDFFEWVEPVDWIITNPPYSKYGQFIRHAMKVSANVVFLAPCSKPFYSFGMIDTVRKWGGIKEIRVYGPGSLLEFPIGFCIGAIHYQSGYTGAMSMTFYEGDKP